MGVLLAGSFVACLFASVCIAQNISDSACAILGGLVNSNASTSRSVPAFSINKDIYLGDDRFPDPNQSFKLKADPSQNWTTSLHVSESHPFSKNDDETEPLYYHSVLLDTAGSKVSRMSTCHSFVQAHDPDLGYSWTKEVLERSLEDSGNCKTMLGNDCVDALKRQYQQEAYTNQSRSGNCSKANFTVPAQCAGMVEPYSMSTKPPPLGLVCQNPIDRATIDMNLTTQLLRGGSFQPRWNTTDQSSGCGGLNTTSNHGFAAPRALSYDESIQFPLVNVMTFFPDYFMRRSLGLAPNQETDIHVEVVCLRPNQIAQGSRSPVSAEELLSREDANFTDVADGGNSTEDEDSSSIALQRLSSPGLLSWAGITLVMAVLF